MLELDNPEWTNLNEAYGKATNIPELLKKLRENPVSENFDSEPMFSLWSSLCHQGDTYSGSFAAVPHLVQICEENPENAHWSIPQLIACIEISRLQGCAQEIADNLIPDYETAIGKLPTIIAKMQECNSNENIVAIGAASFALVYGDVVLAESYLELTPEIAPEFIKWFFSR